MKDLFKKIIRKVFAVGMVGRSSDCLELKHDLLDLKSMLQAQQAYFSHLILR